MESDERFKHIATDPRFKHVPKRERKVIIDKRFQSMFKDKKFQSKYTVDKRGRPVNSVSSEDLKRYYALDDESENSSGSDSEDSTSEIPETENEGKADGNQNRNEEKDAEVWNNDNVEKNDLRVSEKIKERLKNMKIDYARGQGVLLSDSSSSDESETEESEGENADHGWGELDKDAERTDKVTNRLAICNMDWDRIRAVDLMVLFNSFLPTGAIIKSITIYPSDFGLQRMKQEEVKGPIELVQSKNSDDSGGEETEEGSKYHMEKLRQYQLNRLKYYYAVMVCDSAETANKIYTECDGVEYESSATKIDLRFIPDDMEFENKPKEVCDRIPDKYEPRFFTTTALQQAKVELTWDETNPERIEVTKKLSEGKVDDISEADLQAYLASSTDEEAGKEDEEDSVEDSDDANPIAKYRALLQHIENKENKKKEKDVEMEVSWDLNLKEKSAKLVQKKLAEVEEKTPFQQYLDKRKEKRKIKREESKKKVAANNNDSDETDDDIPSDIDMNDPYFAEEFNNDEFKKKTKKSKKNRELNKKDNDKINPELELLLLEENEDNRKHFNLKKIQEKEGEKKKKKRTNKKVEEIDTTDDFQMNVKDDRFSALYTSHHFNIDPTDPHFRKTKGMEAVIEEKLKRRTNDSSEQQDIKKSRPADTKHADLSVLVKSVKSKTKALQRKK